MSGVVSAISLTRSPLPAKRNCVALHLQREQKGAERAQRSLRNIGCAPPGRRRKAQPSTHQECCQIYDTMRVPRACSAFSDPHLAVIEAVEVEFDPGFNVLTGETGAGKSIVVEAVGLLLGARSRRPGAHRRSARRHRSDLRARRQGNCCPARADEPGPKPIVHRWRRPPQLRELSAKLVELHGQHEHQALLDPLTHLSVLDEHAGLTELTTQVADAWVAHGRRTARALPHGQSRKLRLDLITFQLGEIRRRPRETPKMSLAATRQVLGECRTGPAALRGELRRLYESDGSRSLRSAAYGSASASCCNRPAVRVLRRGARRHQGQLEDLAFFLRSYADTVDASPARLQEVEDRLALLERLKRSTSDTWATSSSAATIWRASKSC